MTCRLFVASVVVLSVAHVHAQQAQISGSVTDTSGAVLPGVTVDLVRETGGSVQRTVSDRQGRFTIASVDGGVYALVFNLPGFEPITRTNISVPPGGAVSVGNVSMRVGALAETIQRPAPFAAPRDMRPECLHGQNEPALERQRRTEALAAMQLIAGLLERVPVSPLGYPDWQTLARSKAVMDLQNGAGANAELARKIQWGDAEPLPGWVLTYTRSQYRVQVVLTDSRDPCGFSFNSDQLVNGRLLPLH